RKVGIVTSVMFLRAKIRRKDGKEHRTFSIVENRRVSGGRVVQRHVLYLGEINDLQELAWRKSIEAIEERAPRARTLSLFPDDRCEGLIDDGSIVRLKLKEMRLCRPRTRASRDNDFPTGGRRVEGRPPARRSDYLSAPGGVDRRPVGVIAG